MSNRETPAEITPAEHLESMTAADHYAAAMRYAAEAAPARLGSPRQSGASLGAVTHLLAALALQGREE